MVLPARHRKANHSMKILAFAPDHATATIKGLGPKGFGEAVAASWSGFVTVIDGLMSVDHRRDITTAAEAFVATEKRAADPVVGIVVLP